MKNIIGYAIANKRGNLLFDTYIYGRQCSVYKTKGEAELNLDEEDNEKIIKVEIKEVK